MVVTRVREVFAAMPSHDAVGRDESTNVIVVVATGRDTLGAAAATDCVDGVATIASHAVAMRGPTRQTILDTPDCPG